MNMGQRQQFSDEAFERSVVAASSTQARVDALRPAVKSAKMDHSSVGAIDSNLEGGDASSARVIGGNFVDPMRGSAHSKRTVLALISDEKDEDGNDGLATAGAPEPRVSCSMFNVTCCKGRLSSHTCRVVVTAVAVSDQRFGGPSELAVGTSVVYTRHAGHCCEN